MLQNTFKQAVINLLICDPLEYELEIIVFVIMTGDEDEHTPI